MGLIGKKHKASKNKNILESFGHAYEGLKSSIVSERNLHIHICMAILVIVAGAIFQISPIEWFVCLILIGVVISMELINTAIEGCVDLITTNENQLAKTIKDTSAAAVLVVSFVSALIGVTIFVPRIFSFFSF